LTESLRNHVIWIKLGELAPLGQSEHFNSCNSQLMVMS